MITAIGEKLAELVRDSLFKLVEPFFKRDKTWKKYQDFLVKNCYIPFNDLKIIEQNSETKAQNAISDIKQCDKFTVSISDLPTDKRIITAIGIAAKAIDGGYKWVQFESDNDPDSGFRAKDLCDAIEESVVLKEHCEVKCLNKQSIQDNVLDEGNSKNKKKRKTLIINNK